MGASPDKYEVAIPALSNEATTGHLVNHMTKTSIDP